VRKRRGRGGAAGLARRSLRRESDGSLYDLDERRRVSLGELRDEVRDGRRFRACHHETGADCTNDVLMDVLQSGVAGRGGVDLGAMASVVRLVGNGIIDVLDDRDGRRGRRGDGRGRSQPRPAPPRGGELAE
jgi:PHB/PHA accumulation regulator DNA-binding domain